MPARKPAALIVKHETGAEKGARKAHESSMRPNRPLPARFPARLGGHTLAEAVWRRIMRVYGELEKEIVTRMDQDHLVDYCLLMEQLSEMDGMRKSAQEISTQFENRRVELLKQVSETVDKEEKEKLDEAASKVADKAASALGLVAKLDGSVNRKRKLVMEWRQSLYLTPRAKAGAAPAQKEIVPPPDAMEKLLNDAGIFVGSEKQDEGK